MKAHAKINLWLKVFPPDDTGYHPLDTFFCALDLADELTFYDAQADGIFLEVRGSDVGPNEKNLAYRAALDFYQTTALKPRITIVLEKVIPAGAGLGGGSSDAATVLRHLNEKHGNVLSNDDLLAMAARIGSDVPFFLCGSSCARATGRGEILQAMPALPSRPVLLVMPDFAVSTPEAYRWIDEDRAWSQPESSDARSAFTWPDLVAKATNDFERVLFPRYPQLQRIDGFLGEMGAKISLVSGSGSAVFGIFDTEEERDHAARRIPQSVATATLSL